MNNNLLELAFSIILPILAIIIGIYNYLNPRKPILIGLLSKYIVKIINKTNYQENIKNELKIKIIKYFGLVWIMRGFIALIFIILASIIILFEKLQ